MVTAAVHRAMPRLHQTYLMVSDLAAAERFYTEALGLPVARRGERSVAFETGDCTLKIEADFDAETLDAFGLRPPGDERGDGAVIVLEVDDVDDAHERATGADADVLMPPRTASWGRRLFLVRDPDGYVLEVSRPA